MSSARLGGVKEAHGRVVAAREEFGGESTNDDVVYGFGVDRIVVVVVVVAVVVGGTSWRGIAAIPCSMAGGSRLVCTRFTGACATVVFHRSEGGAHGVVELR
jgi:hypothetical protein